MKYIYISLLILTLSLSAQSVKLQIVETSDVHGAIYPYDFTSAKETGGSLSRVIKYLNEERQKPDQEVILLDNGDILQGTPAVYYYNYEKPEAEHLYARVMNYMQYDAGTVGNHDIETGHAVYDKFRMEINFPWLAANAVDTINNKPYFEPYTIINKSGIKIAVFGMITPGIPNWLPYNIWSGIDFQDMIKVAKEWIPKIIEKEKPDLLIGLFHSGVDYTYGNETATTPRNENACKLVAQQVPGFDIIFVGHDHKTWDFYEVNNQGDSVLVMGPTNSARNIATATVNFTYDDDAQSWKKNISGKIVDMKNYSPDSLFLVKFHNEFEEVNKYVSRSIGTLEDDIDSRYSIFGDASFSDLIHHIQLDITHADVSFTAPLSMNTKLKKGKIYVRDMFNLYRYENLLYSMKLTGEEIDKYLEYSYALWFNQMKSKDDHLLLFQKDEKGNLIWSERYHTPELKNRFYNFDSAEGIEYTVDVSKPVGDKVTITGFRNGSPFYSDSTYVVAVNSYRGNGGGGHLTTGAGISKDDLTKRMIFSTDKDLRFYLMKWIEKEKDIKPYCSHNWKVIPADWYNTAKEKDFDLLYGK